MSHTARKALLATVTGLLLALLSVMVDWFERRLQVD